MKVILRSKPEQTLGILNRLIPWAKKSDWKDVLVRIDMPEKRSRVVSIARDADAADVLFVRSEEVDVINELAPCTEKINEELVAKAIELFARDGLE
jgi:hypothetical protein